MLENKDKEDLRNNKYRQVIRKDRETERQKSRNIGERKHKQREKGKEKGIEKYENCRRN